jgi:hypothetical protein
MIKVGNMKLEELNEKINKWGKNCPYCNRPFDNGYILSGFDIYWAKELNIFGGRKMKGSKNINTHLPSLRCKYCGIIISQYE